MSIVQKLTLAFRLCSLLFSKSLGLFDWVFVFCKSYECSKNEQKKSNQLKSNHSSFPDIVHGLLKIHLFWIKVTQTCFEGGFSVGSIFAGSEKVFSE